ncbi:MAG: TrkA family potassium uptake protein [Chloroflexi bacterium]|nr:TrkA family potassium uptake protein [Chloroflexota bacterium]
MRVMIMGCGRVGAALATMLDRESHEVVILDLDAGQFRRLPSDFHGASVVGNGIDQDVLKRAGIERVDAFAAVTQGDNRNFMAAQIARHIFNVPKVVCRIYDPIREELYHSMGLETISPTTVISRLLKDALER